jgi:hypothetical protein
VKRFGLLAAGLMLMMLPLMQGCQAAHAMSEAPKIGPHPFSQTERIEDVLSRHADAAEDTAQALKDLKAEIASLSDQVVTLNSQQCDLANALDELKADNKAPEPNPISEPSRAAGENPNVPLIDESQVADGKAVDTISDNQGNTWNLTDFIAQNYKRPWTWTGDLDQHLSSVHGVNLQTDLAADTKAKLHAALHEKQLAQATPTPIDGLAPVASSDCPDGKCPLRSRTVTVEKNGVSRSSSNVVTQAPAGSGVSYSRSWSYSYQKPVSKAAARRAARCNGGNCCQ